MVPIGPDGAAATVVASGAAQPRLPVPFTEAVATSAAAAAAAVSRALAAAVPTDHDACAQERGATAADAWPRQS